MRAFTAKQGEWVRTLLAWLLPVGTCAVQWLFWDQFEPYPWLLFYPTAFFAARLGGLWGGIGASVLSSLLVWWFFLPPAFSFTVYEAASPLAVGVFFATGVAFSIFDQALRKSQVQNRTLFERAGDGIARVNQQGVFLDVNPRLAAIVGREQREIVGMQATDLVVGMTPQLWEGINRRLQPDGALAHEYQLRRADGTLLPVEVTVTVLPGGDHLAIVHDISKRKQAEAALQGSEEKWRLVFDLLPVGVSVVDARHNVTDTNQALAQMLGLNVESILAGAYRNRRYFHPDRTLMELDEFPSLRTLAEQQVVRDVEIGVEREDGQIVWTSVSATPVSSSGYSATVTVDISQRKLAEEALAAVAANMKAIIENTEDYIWSVDQECRLLIANAAFQRSIQGQIGRELAAGEYVMGEPFAASARAFWAPLYAQALTGETITREIPFAQRTEGTLEMSLYPIRDAGGKVMGVAGRAVDISARRRLEGAVRASEERLRWALDASSEGLWDWNVARGEVFGNDQWLRLFGYEPGEAPASYQLWAGTLHPDDAPAVLRLLDDCLQGRQFDYRSEHRVVIRSGETRWHRTVGKVVARDGEGRPLRMVGTNADITASKTAEQQLRDSEERFRLIVQNSPAPILIWDESAAVRYASPAFTAVFGATAQELLATAAALQAATAGLGEDELTCERLLETEGITQVEAARWLLVLRAVRRCARQPGDRIQVNINVAAGSGELRDLNIIFQGFQTSAAQVEIVSVVHDITEHRALAHLLREANSELEQQVAVRTTELQESVAELRRANAGKDAFLAAISHELRTPLMGVLSMSELLAAQERGLLNQDQAKYVNAITSSGERLLATVNNVLLYTNLVAGDTPIRREPCQLDVICAAAVRAVQDEAERKQQSIVQAIIPFGLEIESDAQAILHVVKTLLENAIKFTPQGGRIDLSVGVQTGLGGKGESVQIVVTDTGIGMSEEQISGLFRPFVQGDQTLARRFEGLGLGLASVQKMVELLGGTIGLESEPGAGSCVTVTLPARGSGGVDGGVDG